MIVILNDKTHVDSQPPVNTNKTWISSSMTELMVYPDPVLYDIIDSPSYIKEALIEQGLDLYSRRVKVFETDSEPEVKRYIDGAWTVIDPALFFDIMVNRHPAGFGDAEIPTEETEIYDGTITVQSAE